MSFSVQYDAGVTRRVDFSREHLQLALAMPTLGVCRSENWPQVDCPATPLSWSQQGDWLVGQAGDLLWVCALGAAGDAALEGVTGALYRQLFALLGKGWQLQRLWHYLPRINELGAGGLERYRAFCRGRSLAFEQAFGKNFHVSLPAASAVGCEGDSLVIYGCARRHAGVLYLENPLQVPAYRYSQVYGPRAPGFARASLTQLAAENRPQLVTGDCPQLVTENRPQLVTGDCPQLVTENRPQVAAENCAQSRPQTGSEAASSSTVRTEIYISGTASIRDEDSLADAGILGQLAVTVENLNRIAAECGLQHFLSAKPCHQAVELPQAGTLKAERQRPDTRPETAAGSGGSGTWRRFKVYLRHAEDYPTVSHHFGALLHAQDEVVYLRSDICRAELDLEIEASLFIDGREGTAGS